HHVSLLRLRLGDRSLPKALHEDEHGLLPCRTIPAGVGLRHRLHGRESWRGGSDRDGRIGREIRNCHQPFLLDRRDSGHGVHRHIHDAFLLRLRFDEKTRALNAISFAVMTIFSSGISMYAMAKLIQVLHILDVPLAKMGLPMSWSFHLSVFISALIVLGYVFLGGLTSAIYNEVLQFFLIVAGFFPLVFLGLKNVGGWSGLKTLLPSAFTHSW